MRGKSVVCLRGSLLRPQSQLSAPLYFCTAVCSNFFLAFLNIQSSLHPARSKPTNVYSLVGEEKPDFIPGTR